MTDTPKLKWLLVGFALCASMTQGNSETWLSRIKDPALKQCLMNTMEKNKWSTPEDITQLKCHSMGIQSLQGLDLAVNLTSLSIYNNQLSKLDIELTHLKALQVFNISRNAFNTLAISQLPSLEKLYVFDSGLRHLHLSDLPKLLTLKANNNQLESFEYSNTPNLSKIYIFNNQLETLDIHNLPVLHYMDCRQNPMPDELYDEMDKQEYVTYLHDGNAEDWQ